METTASNKFVQIVLDLEMGIDFGKFVSRISIWRRRM